jgi:tetratricopeptide (TPR) repeat protein
MNARAFLGAAFGVACIAAAAVAQAKTPEPRRPGVDGDRNDPKAYYNLGVKMLDHSPTEAADAFYWAIKLDPGWADAYYGRWAALHLVRGTKFLVTSRTGAWVSMSLSMGDIDSLMMRATRLDPFLYRKFDQLILERAMEAAVGTQSAQFTGSVRGDPYTAGNFPKALHDLAIDLPGLQEKFPIYSMRGRLFYMIGAYDSAGAQLTLARDELERLNTEKLLPVYLSKATYDRMLGMVAQKQGRPDAAREAYGRALADDISYAPAHVSLSDIDFAKGDTTAALSEMDLAAQLAPSDGYLAYEYGRALLMAGHDPEALEQMVRATKLEPYYAEPHVLMGAIYDRANYTTEALAAYTAYVTLANHNDQRVDLVQARIDKLKTSTTAAKPPTP